jgi:hypothetical protein
VRRRLKPATFWITSLAAFWVLATSFPLPLGWKLIAPTGAPLFPCWDCGCGCVTAEQCWTNCCCFSPKERIAWARKHGVTPPAYAVLDAAADREQAERAASSAPSSSGGGACCCCADSKAQSTLAPDSCQTDQSLANLGESNPTIKVVTTIGLLKCRGLKERVLLVNWSQLPASPPLLVNLPEPDAWLSNFSEISRFSRSRPPLPPPRLG